MIQRNQLAQSADSPLIKFGLPVLVVIIGFAAYAGLMALRQPPAPAELGNELPLVTVATAAEYSGNIEIKASGLAMATRELELAAEVEGRVKTKTSDCEVGRVVKKGAPLIVIDSENLQNEARQLAAKHQEAVGSLNELESETKATESQIERLGREVDIRKRELDRYLSLRETRSGAVSETELDAARLNFVKAEYALLNLQDQLTVLTSRRLRLENSVALAQAQLDRTNLDLKRCEIKSPVDGVIAEEMIEEERFVSRGTPLVKIIDTSPKKTDDDGSTLEGGSPIEVECNLQIDQYQLVLENVPEPMAPFALPGNDVFITYRANNRDIQWEGKLTRTKGLGVDETTRTMPCIVEVSQPVKENTKGINALVPGMFVKLRIQIESQTPFVEVPAQALQGKDTLWVVKDGVLKKTKVEVMTVSNSKQTNEASDSPRTIVVQQVDGLVEEGSQIVTTPVTYQTENQKVEVRKSLIGESVPSRDSEQQGGEG